MNPATNTPATWRMKTLQEQNQFIDQLSNRRKRERKKKNSSSASRTSVGNNGSGEVVESHSSKQISPNKVKSKVLNWIEKTDEINDDCKAMFSKSNTVEFMCGISVSFDSTTHPIQGGRIPKQPEKQPPTIHIVGPSKEMIHWACAKVMDFLEDEGCDDTEVEGRETMDDDNDTMLHHQ